MKYVVAEGNKVIAQKIIVGQDVQSIINMRVSERLPHPHKGDAVQAVTVQVKI